MVRSIQIISENEVSIEIFSDKQEIRGAPDMNLPDIRPARYPASSFAGYRISG